MAESIVYEDTPFAEYLAEIGSEEELIQQPEIYNCDKEEKKKVMSERLWKTSAEVVSYVKVRSNSIESRVYVCAYKKESYEHCNK